MGTHNETASAIAAVESVAANVAATTHTHTETRSTTNNNNMNNQNETKQQQQQSQEQELEENKKEIYKSVESDDIQQQNTTQNLTYLPKASEPPQVVIIPATQASTVATNAAKKIRRAFSMPRNPFRWSRKFKTSIAADNNSTNGGNDTRNSTTIISCVSGGRTNAGSTVSLSDSYRGNVGKDAVSTEANNTKINNNNTEIKTQGVENNINNNNITNNNNNIENNSGGGNRVIRRSSLRKFLNRIAQHVSTTMNVGVSIIHKQKEI